MGAAFRLLSGVWPNERLRNEISARHRAQTGGRLPVAAAGGSEMSVRQFD
jgi:hypothetical protein